MYTKIKPSDLNLSKVKSHFPVPELGDIACEVIKVAASNGDDWNPISKQVVKKFGISFWMLESARWLADAGHTVHFLDDFFKLLPGFTDHLL